jgi:hypothetical protein
MRASSQSECRTMTRPQALMMLPWRRLMGTCMTARTTWRRWSAHELRSARALTSRTTAHRGGRRRGAQFGQYSGSASLRPAA